MAREFIDSFTEEGAKKLASIINDYWARQGRVANARAVQISLETGYMSARKGRIETCVGWKLRSNLGMGLPPKHPAVS